MGNLERFGEQYRKGLMPAVPPELCEVCGEELEIDPESGEGHCLVCEDPEE